MRLLALFPLALFAGANLAAQPTESSRLYELVARRQQVVNAHLAQRQGLESRLAALSAPTAATAGAPLVAGATVADLASAMRRDSARLALLEDFNRQRIESRFDLQAVRYQTGLEILRLLIRNTEKLDFSTGLASSLAGFESAANPLNSPAFREQLNALGKESSGPKFSLPDILLKNPVISTALSLASLFSSKLKPEEKDKALTRISCVLDFTTQANRDAVDVRRRLEAINAKVHGFLGEADGALLGLTGAVGAERDWARLKRETATTAKSPVVDAIEGYFRTRKAEALARPWLPGPIDELAESNYQLDQVRILLTRNEDLINEVDGFLGQFESIAARYQLVACPAIPNLSTTLAALQTHAKENRVKFRNGWYGDVPAKSRSLLFAAP